MSIFKIITLILFLLLTVNTYANDAPRSLAVIVNDAVEEESISTDVLSKILLGEVRFWEGGGLITLLIQAPVSWERETVLGKIMKMSEPQYRQFWISKVFRTEVASGPKVVLSNDMAAILISKIPGAVAFVDNKDIPSGAKVLKIDNKQPGDPGYPLNF